MVRMTIINAAAEAARENARTSAGRFGEQTHTAPELNLDPYPYPHLKRGLRPVQVDLNVWYRENEAGDYVWHVGAYPIRKTAAGFDDTDTDDNLFPSFELPLSDERAAGLDEDHWVSLDSAPGWLRDAVLPSLVDEQINDTATAAWRKARHEQIIAQGGYASIYDNAHIIDFEAEYPANTPLDAAAGLFNLAPKDGYEDDPERDAAAAELSRRAAAGVGGLLVDVRQLRPGDQVSLAHLAEHFTDADQWVNEKYAPIAGTDPIALSGEVIVSLEGNRHLSLPAGTRLPTVGYIFAGREFTGSGLVQELVRSGDVSFRASKTQVREVVERYNTERGFEPGDAGYIEPINLTLDGAKL